MKKEDIINALAVAISPKGTYAAIAFDNDDLPNSVVLFRVWGDSLDKIFEESVDHNITGLQFTHGDEQELTLDYEDGSFSVCYVQPYDYGMDEEGLSVVEGKGLYMEDFDKLVLSPRDRKVLIMEE